MIRPDSALAPEAGCPDEAVLSDLALGKAPDDSMDAVSEHIGRCLACQKSFGLLDGSEDGFVHELKRAISAAHAAPHLISPELESLIQSAQCIDLTSQGPPRHRSAETVLPVQLGHYCLFEKIGSGGMGVVYKARHLKLNRLAAAKVLRADRLRDYGATERFHREIEVVAALDHPNIVRALDAGEVDGRCFLVMEYVEGIDVALLARRHGPLRMADACEVIRQAALGLQHAHEHELVHRDIKPSNLMLTSDGLIKLLDMGLAKPLFDDTITDPLTASSQLLGTVDFMAPEQSLDPRLADARSDIYGLGCTLYFLLAGEPPFTGPEYDTAMKKLLAHAQARVRPLRRFRPDISPRVEEILKMLLAKEPANRFASSRQVAAALSTLTRDADLRALFRKVHGLSEASGRSPGNAAASDTRRSRGRRSGFGVVVGHAGRKLIDHPFASVTTVLSIVLLLIALHGLVIRAPRLSTGAEETGQWHAPKAPTAATGPDHAATAENDARGRQTSAMADSVRAFVAGSDVSEPARSAMLKMVNDDPRQGRWAGRLGQSMFALAAERIPGGDIRPRATPLVVNAAQIVAIQSLLTEKALLERYAPIGLTDTDGLCRALRRSAKAIFLTGQVQGFVCQARAHGAFAVSYVVADTERVVARLHGAAALSIVKDAYRDEIHTRLRGCMQNRNWSDALRLWDHLRERHLASPNLYVDAAICCKELQRPNDALKLLDEAYQTFSGSATPAWLERSGDVAFQLGGPGQPLARKAYERASERLRDVQSGFEEQP